MLIGFDLHSLLLSLAFELAGLACIVTAVRSARTSQGAVAWVVFLFAAPQFAVPVFLIFGHRRYPGYIASRRDLRQEMIAIRDLNAKNAPRPEGLDVADRASLRAFQQMSGVPLASGNAVELLIDGPAAFPAMLAAIDAAQSYVLLELYTFLGDDLGQEFARHLKARAQAGVQVRVLYDSLGSNGISRAFLADLRAAGVDIRNFHALRHARSRFQVNFRNHRKILVVDGNTAFTGGLNVADEYMGRDPRFGRWRDTMVRIEGPAVAQLQFTFAEDWHWSAGDNPELDWAPRRASANMNAMILSPSPSDRVETGGLYFVNAVAAAERRIWIASPYFVPDTDVLTALKLAALRGVEVRLLVPEKRDHWLVWLAAFALFDEVREAGVEVWRYHDGFLHQKVLLVDDEIASVGSINLDNRSCRLNFEVTAIVADRGFAAQVEVMLNDDFALATKLTTPLRKQPFWLRTAAPLARLFAPVL